MMAHYAFLDENNIVTEVITGIDETELIEGLDPETWYGNFRGQTCKRTSYNSYHGKRKNPITNELTDEPGYRKNYAGIGYIYDSLRDAFYEQSPYPSWILDEETCTWISPVPYPMIELSEEPENHIPISYIWDENTTSWLLLPPSN